MYLGTGKGRCGTFEPDINAVESDIEKRLTNQLVVPVKLTNTKMSAFQWFKNRDNIVIKKKNKSFFAAFCSFLVRFE